MLIEGQFTLQAPIQKVIRCLTQNAHYCMPSTEDGGPRLETCGASWRREWGPSSQAEVHDEV